MKNKEKLAILGYWKNIFQDGQLLFSAFFNQGVNLNVNFFICHIKDVDCKNKDILGENATPFSSPNPS